MCSSFLDIFFGYTVRAHNATDFFVRRHHHFADIHISYQDFKLSSQLFGIDQRPMPIFIPINISEDE